MSTSRRRSVTRCRSWRAAVLLVIGVSACSADGSDVVGPSNVAPLGEAGGAGAGRALCGRDGEPCCAPPLLQCEPRGTCNVDTARCEPSAESSAAVRQLCRSASDCAANESCCDAGLVSTCVALTPNAQCPTIDLAIDAVPPGTTGLGSGVLTSRIEPLTCESDCLNATGRHRTLGVAARVINLGNAELLLGTPGDPGISTASGTFRGELLPLGCSEYSYVEDLVRFELLGADGSVYSRTDGRLSPGCIEGATPPFSCDFLGLPSRVYSSELSCKELLIDGMAPGDYTLRFTVDPNDRVVESDESNNTFESVFSLFPLNVLGECPPSVDGVGFERDCGWAAASTAGCNPEEIVSLGCPTCQGDPVLRVCAGSDACIYEEAIASNDDAGELNTLNPSCPQVTFTCSASGSYSSFVAPFVAGSPITCNVARLVTATTP